MFMWRDQTIATELGRKCMRPLNAIDGDKCIPVKFLRVIDKM